MKIAVACENNQVFQHFGHTPEFAVFTVENKNVVSREILSCGDTGHGALAGLLRQGGIDLLICGGIGGASGDVDEIIKAFLADKLQVNEDFQCRHHDHESGHSCGSHGCGGGKCH